MGQQVRIITIQTPAVGGDFLFVKFAFPKSKIVLPCLSTYKSKVLAKDLSLCCLYSEMFWLRILGMTLTSSFYVSALNTTTATPSLYDKETLFLVIKTVQPMFVAFFSTGSLSLECFNAFNSVADPWLQALLPVYFTLFDTNLDGKLTATDVSPLGVLVTYVSFLIMGADLGNDYVITLAEFNVFLNTAPFQPNQVFQNALLLTFQNLDRNGDQSLSYLDIFLAGSRG
ncbi:uncharacterized protein LOC106069400 [Biomphalaria glabrata]|uniref:Uncharacterized protein LOC106069400 n=1 Tax=Biomphalaria glabrata TaxID=6526 RepID=A0A9W2YSE4_BIOGL|nr:uncharacterized protein LOC106069400 [Biomphalaria glabrata]